MSLEIMWSDCRRLIFWPIRDAALQWIETSAWQSSHLDGLVLLHPQHTYKICRSAEISVREVNDALECTCALCANLLLAEPRIQTLTHAAPS